MEKWEMFTAIVSAIYTAVTLGPKIYDELKTARAQRIIQLVDYAIIAAYNAVVVPARAAGGETKLSSETQRAALQFATDTLAAECSSLPATSARVLLERRLEALKREHVLDDSTEAMKGPKL